MDSALHLLGIARKAGRLEIGEEPVGAAARARQARLILVAADAAENTVRRAEHFAQGGNVPHVQVPYTKGELGYAVGRASCAMLALTDVGLASALAGKLAAADPQRYGQAAPPAKAQPDREEKEKKRVLPRGRITIHKKKP